jgi:LysR family transcriptional activator of nhaA
MAEPLNYHHLLYFWHVAREGSVAGAAARLRLSQATVSAQVNQLEERIGTPLFERVGRNLQLTETGRLTFEYAAEIFTLGEELQATLEGMPRDRPPRLVVGVADAIPKVMVGRLLEPILAVDPTMRLICREGSVQDLLAALALFRIDVVLADAPIAPGLKIKGFSHLLGETGLTFFAAGELLKRHPGRFPKRLDRAPFLAPGEGAVQRRLLEDWFERSEIRPTVRAEFDDSALLHAWGAKGIGFFAGPTSVEKEIREQFGVEVVGRDAGLRERIYAITPDRRLKHPAVVTLVEQARTVVFDRA